MNGTPRQPCSVFLPAEKWSKRYGGEFFTLNVPESRTSPRGGFTEYKISISCAEFTWDVWRRYREFASFRESVSKVSFLSEGHLPDLDNMSPEFVARRREGLEEFLAELLKFPGISLDSSVRDFLEIGRYETYADQQNSI